MARVTQRHRGGRARRGRERPRLSAPRLGACTEPRTGRYAAGRRLPRRPGEPVKGAARSVGPAWAALEPLSRRGRHHTPPRAGRDTPPGRDPTDSAGIRRASQHPADMAAACQPTSARAAGAAGRFVDDAVAVVGVGEV
jgi:hypothetical protein